MRKFAPGLELCTFDKMRFISTIGEHLIVIRLPVFNEVHLVFWVTEITVIEIGCAAEMAIEVVKFLLERRYLRQNRKCALSVLPTLV